MKALPLSLHAVEQLAHQCLLANGCDEANASAVAETVTTAERDGCAAHGLIRIPGYIAALRCGKVKGDAAPEISRRTPSLVHVDGHNGFAPLALKRARPQLVTAARETGVAAMALVRSHHFAALWNEVEPLAEEGLCAMACTAYMPTVAPAGGVAAFFGTNPFAFAWPRGGCEPMVFDFATSARAKGEVTLAARAGHTLPEGVGLDKDGQPTTSPQAILEGGVLLPFGGYKGSHLAMMVELLAAGLVGDRFSFEAAEHDNPDDGPPQGGEFILAMDPARFRGDDFLAHTDGFFARLLAIEGVRLPSERRYAHRKRVLAGQAIEVPEDVHGAVVKLTKEAQKN